jgi:hypothetical protein
VKTFLLSHPEKLNYQNSPFLIMGIYRRKTPEKGRACRPTNKKGITEEALRKLEKPVEEIIHENALKIILNARNNMRLLAEKNETSGKRIERLQHYTAFRNAYDLASKVERAREERIRRQNR